MIRIIFFAFAMIQILNAGDTTDLDSNSKKPLTPFQERVMDLASRYSAARGSEGAILELNQELHRLHERLGPIKFPFDIDQLSDIRFCVEKLPYLCMEGCGHCLDEKVFVDNIAKALNRSLEVLSSSESSEKRLERVRQEITRDAHGFAALVCPSCGQLGEQKGHLPFAVLKALCHGTDLYGSFKTLAFQVADLESQLNGDNSSDHRY